MRKIIAAINMTLDGYCDHTVGIVDDELHEHYNAVLRNMDTLLYGRTTYQLMESYWPSVVKNPTGNKPIDDFAVLIDNIEKIVYSRTLPSVTWKNSTLKREVNKAEIEALKQLPGKPIGVGSPGMIAQLSELALIDEYHLCIHPIIIGHGLPLFKNITKRVDLTLLKTKTFGSGVVVHYYQTKR